ncbi:hypothetical protein [Nonomuraea cavernae]|uniref:hypothetical protein n=1 Tax=Nonomuraea cavernae TaxID=2045107 RepID=UPI0033C60D9C
MTDLGSGGVMALRFIGIDPDTAGGNCPSVWVDEVSGDLLFQGWEVTDQTTLNEVAAVSPIAAHEKIVRLPARMRTIIQEASSDGAADLR